VRICFDWGRIDGIGRLNDAFRNIAQFFKAIGPDYDRRWMGAVDVEQAALIVILPVEEGNQTPHLAT